MTRALLFAWLSSVLCASLAASCLWAPWDSGAPPAAVAVASLFGAAGASVHALNSLAVHCGRGDFEAGWTLWYASRPLVGAGLAALAGLAASMGLLALADSPSPLALAFVGGAAGLSSHDAGERVKRISAALFKTQGEQ